VAGAVVAESPDNMSVVFRTYLTQLPILGTHHVRASFLDPGPALPGDVVSRYYAALDAGDVEAVVATFSPDGYFREPVGPDAVHRGSDELRTFFAACFSSGGVRLEPCVVTDDGVRCAVEYNFVRWGSHDLNLRRASASTSGARTDRSPRPACTSTSSHQSNNPEALLHLRV
jgi:hypothetical protein